MSLRISLPPQLFRSQSQRPLKLFFCPSCSVWRLARPPSHPRHSRPRPELPKLQSHARPLSISAQRRQHTDFAPKISAATVINASADVRPHFKELYHALDALKQQAGSYVNLSRLELALRGLQNSDPVVRVAGVFKMLIVSSDFKGAWSCAINADRVCC